MAGQRDIAIEHENPRVIGQIRQGLSHSVAGTQLRALGHPVYRGFVRGFPDLVSTVSYHRMDLFSAQEFGGIDNVMEHRATGNRMQHLGQCGFHSGTLAGGQNDDV